MGDIAIIGMGCRFPGAATSVQGFWKMIVEGQSAWSEFPADRLNIDGFYHPDGHRQGNIHFKGAHFLRNNLAAFDAAFFNMTEEAAEALDPQQRMLLETSYEAIESAGLRVEDLKGSDTSVYIGAFVRDYEQISLRDMDFQPRYAATGSGTAIMSNRLSYFYDLRGPSMTIDTGCSGSMVALHQACQSIIAGDSSLAFAGGAGLILAPNTMMPMTALNFLSPDGRSYTFDSRANGYGRGEGVGLVILKKLCDALRDNDPIRAVIRSTCLSQDGRTAGITLPNPCAQVVNISKTYEQANLHFGQTGYVECHGTGTQAGDTAELQAIAQTLSRDRSCDKPLFVGSVKPNIGHLEGAAGIAGVIKAALVLENATIPPNINFKEGNPDIKFKEWKLKVPTEPRLWPIPGIRRASVNCFGFGGTNAHAVLDEGQHYIEANRQSLAWPERVSSEIGRAELIASQRQLFLLSGHNNPCIERSKQALLAHIKSLPWNGSQQHLDNMAYTLDCRRSNFKRKGFVTAMSGTELVDALTNLHAEDFVQSHPSPNFKTAFIFCGQGAQRAEMGRDLMGFPVFRKSLQLASDYLKDELRSPYDLIEEIMKPVDISRINEPDISQPATTALQVALTDLMTSFGIQPTAVIGHSSGEIAAAYACSIISQQTAWTLAYHRGVCAKRLRDRSETEGSMVFVAMSEESINDMLRSFCHPLEITVACVNSSKSVTLSGDARQLSVLVKLLRCRDIFCREVVTGVAYHSNHMDSIEEEYLDAIRQVPYTAGMQTCEMYSTLTGKKMHASDYTHQYWADNLKSPVQFADAMEAMLEHVRPEALIELSPHAVLRAPSLDAIDTTAGSTRPHYTAALIKTEDEQITLLTAVGELWARGCNFDMSQVVSRNASVLDLETLKNLPPYPWDHSNTFWHESTMTKDYRMRKHGRKDMIGAPCVDASSQEPRWRGFLRVSESPWLKDHRIQQTVLYPAAGMISTVIEGARQHVPDGVQVCGFEIHNMEILKPMVIPETSFGLETMVNMRRASSDASTTCISFDWSIYGRVYDGMWTHHARGIVHAVSAAGSAALVTGFDAASAKMEAVRGRLMNVEQFYDSLDLIGMNYGPAFRNITTLARGGSTSVGTIEVAKTKDMMPFGHEFDHVVHPTTLDSAFQLLFALEERPMVPTSIDSVYISTEVSPDSLDVQRKFIGHATAARQGLRGAKASIVLADGVSSDKSIVIKGLHLTALATPEILPAHRNLCAEMQWKEDYTTSMTHRFEKLLDLMTHKYPQINILQIGQDIAIPTHILRLLWPSEGMAPRIARYSFDENHPFCSPILKHVLRDTPLRHVPENRKPQEPERAPKYHLILALQPFIGLYDLERYLHPDGVMLRKEEERLATNYESDSACSVDEEAHRVVLQHYDGNTGSSLTLTMVSGPDKHRLDCRQQHVVILLPDTITADVLRLKNNLLKHLTTIYVQVSDCSFHDVARDEAIIRDRLVVSLLDLATCPFFWNCQEADFNIFKKIRNEAKSILWITQGAGGPSKRPQSALVTGLARTLASEEPEKILVTVSLSCDTSLSASTTSKIILRALKRSMLLEVTRQPRELEYIESGNRLLIPRLMTCQPLNQLVEDNLRRLSKSLQPFLGGEKKTLTVLSPGGGDEPVADFLFTSQQYSAPLAPEDVEISLAASALHQGDLKTFMGLSKYERVGVDVQGIVIAVGSDVTDLLLGECVVAISPEGISNRVRVNRRFVKRMRRGLSECIPSIWVSSFYGLAMRCRIGPRTRVLVHRGATATGQVAIQIAKLLGAQVFTTVCNDTVGDDCQRATLTNMFHFADAEIEDCSKQGWDRRLLEKTGGYMMDIILIPGEIPFNSNIVKKTGTVIHIDDDSIGQNMGQQKPPDHSILRINFAEILVEEPDLVADILEDVAKFIQRFSSQIHSTQHPKLLAITDSPGTFSKTLRDKPNLGATLVFADESDTVEVSTRPAVKDLRSCIDHGTYVLAGGLGGLGRAIAQHLVDHGAKNLLFLSRAAHLSVEASCFLDQLRGDGIDARHCAADICDIKALQHAVDRLSPAMPPVSGMIQGAAVLRDKLFETMTYDDWRTAVLPKTQGTLNLVDVFDHPTRKPWFIFLSSSSGIIGNRGQANYAAGNAFMDALAGSGLIHGRAVSLDIGPVQEIGMVADSSHTMKKLRETGFIGIRRLDFLKIVERAIAGDLGSDRGMPSQVVLGVGTGGLMLQNQPSDPFWASTALYSNLNCIDMPPPDLAVIEGPTPTRAVDGKIPRDNMDETAAIIEDCLRVELGSRLATVKAQDIDMGRSIASYGVDSLVAVQIRSWAAVKIGLHLSIFAILAEEPMREFCRSMAEKVFALEDEASA